MQLHFHQPGTELNKAFWFSWDNRNWMNLCFLDFLFKLFLGKKKITQLPCFPWIEIENPYHCSQTPLLWHSVLISIFFAKYPVPDFEIHQATLTQYFACPYLPGKTGRAAIKVERGAVSGKQRACSNLARESLLTNVEWFLGSSFSFS